MSRIIVLIVGILWASLLLVSWGTAETPPTQADSAPAVRNLAHNPTH